MNNAARALLVALLGLVAPQWLHASPFAYVTHQNGVSVIDLGIMLVVNEIPLAGAGAVAVQPTRNRAYVGYGSRIAIVDRSNGTASSLRPASATARGIPYTTHVSSASVRIAPPRALIQPAPSSPSLPIPVMSTPII